MKDNDFDLVNLPEEARDPEIKPEDFTLQVADESVHEQKFQTKPTTFFKDSLKRFKKNKSSVVATYILGALILLAIFVPIFDPYPVSGSLAPEYKNLEPKLFNGGGFWDGTKLVKDIPVDTSVSSNPSDWIPDPDNFVTMGIQRDTMEFTGEIFTNNASKYGNGGYFQIGYYGGMNAEEALITSYSPSDLGYTTFTLNLDVDQIYVKNFETADAAAVYAYTGGQYSFPSNYLIGDIILEMMVHEEGKEEMTVVPLTDSQPVHEVNEFNRIDVNQKIIDAGITQREFDNFYFRLHVLPPADKKEEYKNKNVCSLVKNLVFETNSEDKKQKAYFGIKTDYKISEDEDPIEITGISFDNAMEMCSRKTLTDAVMVKFLNIGYWKVESDKYFREMYLGKCVYASFRYDTYYAVFGPQETIVDQDMMNDWAKLGYLKHGIRIDKFDTSTYDHSYYNKFVQAYGAPIVILDSENCPIASESLWEFNIDEDFDTIGGATGEYVWSIKIKVYNYSLLGHKSMPKYLFGTDKQGYDMFKYVFEGLRNSLLLGVLTFAVCFVFGLIWGAICGYFGGTTDLIMERITDILAGLPWIVLMTLIILKAGQTFWTFALALCLTGWIGTAATTRTQFYRFRGREYVLASRTLGASDARLIAKHILPNALGTIITGAVLMIPSVIFSEATISYLGLGFKGLSSLGVILSDNQAELFNHPYQLIFPSVVIALIMISFNLFGNGLRDAINPSLKGEDE